MPVPLDRSQCHRCSWRGIVWFSIAMASFLPASCSRAEGPGPRVWTLSDDYTQPVAYVAFSPDQTTIAASSQDGKIRLWDLASGRVRFTLDTQIENQSSPVAFSPDGKTLASRRGLRPQLGGPGPGTIPTGGITLWDVSTGRPRTVLDVPLGYFLSLGYSADGEALAWMDWDGVLRIWDLQRNRFRSVLPLPSRTAAISPDFKTAAVAGRNHTILLVDVAARKERAALGGYKNPISSLAFSPDGKTLAACAREPSELSGPRRHTHFPSEIKLWDLTCDPPRERLSLGNLSRWSGVRTFSPDSRLLAVGLGTHDRICDSATGGPVADLNPSGSNVVFSSDGRSLAAGMVGSVEIWDTATWSRRDGLGGRTASTIAYTPDGKTLAAGLSDGTIALWDVAGERVRMVLQGYTQRVSSLAISPDGKHLAAGGLDGVITLWVSDDRREESAFAYGHSGEVTSLAFSPRGTTLASGGKDTTVRLWNVEGFEEFAVLHGHRFPVSCVAFSPDGHTLASSGHDGTLRFWDIANRREKAVVNGHTVKVGKSREETQVIDGETISRRVAVPGETEELGVSINCLAYSPDGKTLATGDHAMWQTGGVSLRHAATGQERVNFKPLHFVGSEPQLPDINAMAYSPDGKLLASAGYNSIRLSDAATGKELAVLKTGIPGAIPDVAFSPDGQTLASCSVHVVQFWNVAAALQLAAKSSR